MRRMNKRGEDWLNVSEIIVAVVCIALSLLLLSSATLEKDEKTIGKIEEAQITYKTTQFLRTLSQTPLTITLANDEPREFTFAQAANNYFEIKDLLETRKSTLTAKKKLEYETNLRRYTAALTEAAELSGKGDFTKNTATFIPKAILLSLFLKSKLPEEKTLQLTLEYGNGDSIYTLELVEVAEFGLNTLPEDFAIVLPAYLKHQTHSLPGDYFIEVSLK